VGQRPHNLNPGHSRQQGAKQFIIFKINPRLWMATILQIIPLIVMKFGIMMQTLSTIEKLVTWQTVVILKTIKFLQHFCRFSQNFVCSL